MTMRILDERFVFFDEPPRVGGSARVFRASDHQANGRVVAVKILESRTRDIHFLRASLNRELQVLHEFRHPNVVELIDFAVDDGEGNPYIVLEWIEKDLAEMLTDQVFEGWDDFAPIALGILSGLAAVHQREAIHRDLKPENVLITESNIPKLTDFGIAKIKQFLNAGVTFAGHGTPPYTPPEDSVVAYKGDYVYARDVFAFGVLVVQALTGSRPGDYPDVCSRLDHLDLHPYIKDFLSRCLAEDPGRRPPSAEAALTELKAFQDARAQRMDGKFAINLSLPSGVRNSVSLATAIDATDIEEFIQDDLAASTALSLAPLYTDADGNAHDSDVLAFAGAFRYRLRPDRIQPGAMAIIEAIQLPSHAMERDRDRGWEGNLKFKFGAPLDPSSAEEQVSSLLGRLAEHRVESQLRAAQERERGLFRSWRSLLEAKRKLEETRAVPLHFQAFRQEGKRVFFTLSKSVENEMAGQAWMVKIGPGLNVGGEIEDVAGRQLRLFLERGNPSNLRSPGVLVLDSEASLFALEKQRQALDSVRFGRSLRPDMAELLIEPGRSRVPVPTALENFFHGGLDESKRAAVQAGLGARDFLAVEGPPGTGKTTFIAELIAQFLHHNPGSRVLLTSQTHIALDNALDVLRRLNSYLKLVRVGRSERIGPEVDDLRLDRQLEQWREDALTKARTFLRLRAQELGITALGLDARVFASKLRSAQRTANDAVRAVGFAEQELALLIAELEGLAATQDDIDGVEGRSSHLQQTIAEHRENLVRLKEERDFLIGSERLAREALSEHLKISDEGVQQSTERILELTESHQFSWHPDLTPLIEIYSDWEGRFGRSSQFNGALMARADVVAATCVGLAGVKGGLEIEYDLCILDEASKATATEALVPLSRSRRWILVGDRKQLPPFQEEAMNDAALLERYEIQRDQMRETLFDILSSSLPEEALISLRLQHRMHPTIGRLVSHVFYEGQLESAERPTRPSVVAAFQSPVVWYSTASIRRRGETIAGTGFVNLAEAAVVRNLLDRLNFACSIANEPGRLKVAVLSGYVGQKDQVIRTLAYSRSKWNHLEVEVATVDAYQGREADVVLMSVTRSNLTKSLGFLRSRNRINVALSRARDGLVIVGDDDFCRQVGGDNPLRDVMDYIERGQECLIEAVELDEP